MRRILLITTAAVALAPAAGHAATARFTGTFEATTSVEWDQPYGVGLKDCKGDHYVEQRGDETWTAKSRKPFKVVVKKLPGVTFWQYGGGIEAAGMVTRNWTYRAGTTGGWCGGESTEPSGDRDCGTPPADLPAYVHRVEHEHRLVGELRAVAFRFVAEVSNATNWPDALIAGA
jgi:hypothetical protein